MKIGDLIKWEGVKNDIQEDLDVDYGLILDFRKFSDLRNDTKYIHKVLIQFHNEIIWLPLSSVKVINEQ